jgi:hypothetical protein
VKKQSEWGPRVWKSGGKPAFPTLKQGYLRVARQLERLSNCDETMMGEGLRVRKVGSPPLFLKIYSPVNAQE